MSTITTWNENMTLEKNPYKKKYKSNMAYNTKNCILQNKMTT